MQRVLLAGDDGDCFDSKCSELIKIIDTGDHQVKYDELKRYYNRNENLIECTKCNKIAWLACRYGDIEFVKYLYQKGVDFFNIEVEHKAQLPLFIACHMHHASLVNYLMQIYANRVREGALIESEFLNFSLKSCNDIIIGNIMVDWILKLHYKDQYGCEFRYKDGLNKFEIALKLLDAKTKPNFLRQNDFNNEYILMNKSYIVKSSIECAKVPQHTEIPPIVVTEYKDSETSFYDKSDSENEDLPLIKRIKFNEESENQSDDSLDSHDENNNNDLFELNESNISIQEHFVIKKDSNQSLADSIDPELMKTTADTRLLEDENTNKLNNDCSDIIKNVTSNGSASVFKPYLESLHKYYRDEDKINHQNCIIIWLACLFEDLKFVEHLIAKGINLSIQIDGHMANTPLRIACSNNHQDMIKLLMKHNADNINTNKMSLFNTLIFVIEYSKSEVFELLTENMVANDLKDQHGNTLLHLAVKKNDFKIIESALKCTKHKNAVNNEGKNVLTLYQEMYLSTNDYASEITKLLTKNGVIMAEKVESKFEKEVVYVNANDTIKLIDDSLLQAIKDQNIQYLSDFIKENDYLNIRDKKSKPLWHYIIEFAPIGVINLMLSKPNVDIDIVDANKVTALMLACEKRGLDVVQLLINHQANPNLKDGSVIKLKDFVKNHKLGCNSALHYAVKSIEIEKVEIILSRLKDINICNNEKHNALVTALKHFKEIPEVDTEKKQNMIAIIRVLIERGINIAYRDYESNDSVYYACQTKNLDVIECFTNSKFIASEKQINREYKIAMENAINHAASAGDLKIVKYLVDNGYDLNNRNPKGFTPLLIACQDGFVELVKYLISNGACVTARNHNLDGALHLAVSHCADINIVQLLLTTPIEINAKNIDGMTAIKIVDDKLFPNNLLQTMTNNPINVGVEGSVRNLMKENTKPKILDSKVREKLFSIASCLIYKGADLKDINTHSYGINFDHIQIKQTENISKIVKRRINSFKVDSNCEKVSVDRRNSCLYFYTPESSIILLHNLQTNQVNRVNFRTHIRSPRIIFVNNKNSHLHIYDSYYNRIFVFNTVNFNFVKQYGYGLLHKPNSIEIETNASEVYAAETDCIKVIDMIENQVTQIIDVHNVYRLKEHNGRLFTISRTRCTKERILASYDVRTKEVIKRKTINLYCINGFEVDANSNIFLIANEIDGKSLSKHLYIYDDDLNFCAKKSLDIVWVKEFIMFNRTIYTCSDEKLNYEIAFDYW